MNNDKVHSHGYQQQPHSPYKYSFSMIAEPVFIMTCGLHSVLFFMQGRAESHFYFQLIDERNKIVGK
jgi:hypothetical protein